MLNKHLVTFIFTVILISLLYYQPALFPSQVLPHFMDVENQVYEAAFVASVDEYKALLKKHNLAFNFKYSDMEREPIHAAAKGDNVKLLEFLVKEGADVNVETKNKETPLEFAGQGKAHDAALFLLKNGAKLDSMVYGEFPVVLRVLQRLNSKVLEQVIEAKYDLAKFSHKGQNAFHIAVANPDPEVLNMLVKTKQMDIDAVDDEGYTPLMRAIQQGNEAAALQLLELGARKFEAHDSIGFAALHHAACNGKKTLVSKLLALGADPEAAYPTALTKPVRATDDEDVIALIEAAIAKRKK